MKKSSVPLVHLKKDPRRPATVACFVESIVDSLRRATNVGDVPGNEVYVNCETTEDGLILNAAHLDCDLSRRIILCRPPFCPIRSLSTGYDSVVLPDQTKKRGVNIGVAILLESSDCSVLLTRRSKTMRTFPHVWVPPGGHMDQGETLQQAGIRELVEETGIQLEDDEGCTSLLGLWESAFPPMINLGPPTRHHIVVYLHHKAKETASDINAMIQLQANEVDASTWICSCVAEKIVATDNQFAAYNASVTAAKVCHSSPELCAKHLVRFYGILMGSDCPAEKGYVIPASPLFAQVSKTYNERVSTGTKYALKLWLNFLRMRT